MNITGVITEYNPLHNGHVYHISRSRDITKADAVVCVMSGNFVQRGLPAIIDKWKRAEMALKNGIDLVLELPAVYSISSAEFFASGSVSLLNSIGVVNNICFGSEEGNVDILFQIAGILANESESFRIHLKNQLDEGLSFPTARNRALKCHINDNRLYKSPHNLDEILNSSNNILGIEYCKNLIRLNSSIKPYTIKRLGSSYNDESLESSFSSATAIRKYLQSKKSLTDLKKFVPDNIYETLKFLYENNYGYINPDSMLPYLKYKSFTENNFLDLLPDASEGLHNRIKNSIINSDSFEETILAAKSKRYTHSRISRLLCQYFIGFEKYNILQLRSSECSYGRVLGFNKIGASLLKKMKTESKIPIYTKLPKNPEPALQLDIQSTNAYSIINKNIHANSDYLISPIHFV